MLQTKTSQQVFLLKGATFSLECVLNIRNLRTREDVNLHAIRSYALQRKYTIKVRADILRDSLFVSYILTERLDGCIYLAFLQVVLPEM